MMNKDMSFRMSQFELGKIDERLCDLRLYIDIDAIMPTLDAHNASGVRQHRRPVNKSGSAIYPIPRVVQCFILLSA